MVAGGLVSTIGGSATVVDGVGCGGKIPILLSLSTPTLSHNKSISSLLRISIQLIQILIWVLFSTLKPQMGRKQNDPEAPRFTSLTLLLVGVISCVLVYTVLSVVLNPNASSKKPGFQSLALVEGSDGGGCCRGIEKLELWGTAVKWGSEFKFNSSKECCESCKAMCSGNDGPCLCDSWVFCGDKEACGSKFGEVRLNSFSTFDGFLIEVLYNYYALIYLATLYKLVNLIRK